MIELSYKKQGDCLVPDLALPEAEPLNKYGLMRRSYLKNHREVLYDDLLLSGKLPEHLAEVSRTAAEWMERTMEELTAKNPPPDKAADQMGWAAHMNGLSQQAEEFVLAELVHS